MSDIYYKVIVPFKSEENKELLIAWLSFHGAESIIEEEVTLEAYTKGNPQELIDNMLETGELSSSSLSFEKIENKNWNAEWEANFQPVIIHKVYIRAPFHDPPSEDFIDLIIAPKMAFGTGHHETTHMMIQEMSSLDFNDLSVLDYGCGTGILSVYASKLGASHVSGCDIQPESMDNSWEQVELNGLNQKDFTFKLGFLDEFQGEKFDIILANINRHVLLDKAEELKNYLKPGGRLLMSGILDSDRKKIVTAYTTAGFSLGKESQREEWCCFLFS